LLLGLVQGISVASAQLSAEAEAEHDRDQRGGQESGDRLVAALEEVGGDAVDVVGAVEEGVGGGGEQDAVGGTRRTMPIRDRKMNESTSSERNAIPTASGVVAPLMIRNGRCTAAKGMAVSAAAMKKWCRCSSRLCRKPAQAVSSHKFTTSSATAIERTSRAITPPLGRWTESPNATASTTVVVGSATTATSHHTT
jgi:hypothetical protein